MSRRHHVFLVPGFFGFANLGDLAYFGHVRAALAAELGELGAQPRVEVVRVPPTSSLVQRARRLHEAVLAAAGGDDAPIHLVGHSSGGLDIRLFLAPTALSDAEGLEGLAQRVRSAVFVATPHLGTPLASFFSSVLGQQLLRLLSMSTIYLLRAGTLPLSLLGSLSELLRGAGGAAPSEEQLIDELFASGPPEVRGALRRFVEEVRADQSLIPQLSVEAMELFNASQRDRPGTRYASVATLGCPPSLGTRLAAGLNPLAHATRTLYEAFYRICAAAEGLERRPLTEAWRAALTGAFGQLPGPADNDGVVPTLSQLWGEPLAAVRADHLDVIGHFEDRAVAPPHFDWLSSGTGFTRPEFLGLWKAVASYQFNAAMAAATPDEGQT